jgi:hypothetical protein
MSSVTTRGPTRFSTVMPPSVGSGRSEGASARSSRPRRAPASDSFTRGSFTRMKISCLPVPFNSACTTDGAGPERLNESSSSVYSIGNDTSMVVGRSV